MITTRGLTRAAAVAAALGGAIYIAIQFIHPLDEIESLSTQLWINVHILSFAEAVLLMIGLAGIYLHQARQLGLLGLIGYAMFALFFVLQASFNFAGALIAPLVAVDAPELAVDFVGLFGRYAATRDLGLLATIPAVGAVLYIGGALALGVAIIRAHVLPRGAAILLIIAAAITPVAGALLPHTLERMAAVPMGLALMCLGISLWVRLQRPESSTGQNTENAEAPAVSRRATS